LVQAHILLEVIIERKLIVQLILWLIEHGIYSEGFGVVLAKDIVE